MMVHQRYPLQMTHPSFRPAVLSDSDARSGEHGSAALWPPVTVNNEDQEEYYQSRGYVSPDAGMAEAFVTQQAAPVPAGYAGPKPYPRWENGKLVQDPHAILGDKTWPMYVVPDGKSRDEGVVVKNPDEYHKVMGRAYEIPGRQAHSGVAVAPKDVVDADELAEFRAWKAAQAAAKTEEAEQKLQDAEEAERDELIALAEELGIRIDKRWSTDKIREKLDKATATE